MSNYHVSFDKTLEVALEVEVRATCIKGCEGRYYGMPEDCYPAEPDEVDTVAVYFDGEEVTGKLGEYLASLVSEEEILLEGDENDGPNYDDVVSL